MGSNRLIAEKFGTIIGHQMRYKHWLELWAVYAKSNKKNLLYKTHSVCPKKDLANKVFVQCGCSRKRASLPYAKEKQMGGQPIHPWRAVGVGKLEP